MWLFFTCIFTLIKCLTCPQVSSSIFGPKIGHFGQPKKSEKCRFQPQTGLWTLFLMVRMFNWDNFHFFDALRLVEIDFLDFINTTETFAAFCGGCLSFLFYCDKLLKYIINMSHLFHLQKVKLKIDILLYYRISCS